MCSAAALPSTACRAVFTCCVDRRACRNASSAVRQKLVARRVNKTIATVASSSARNLSDRALMPEPRTNLREHRFRLGVGDKASHKMLPAGDGVHVQL